MLEPSGKKILLINIYVGQVENIARNIQAAFVRLSDSVNGYLPLNQCTNAIYTGGRKKQISPCVLDDQLLVPVNREAMKRETSCTDRKSEFFGKISCSDYRKSKNRFFQQTFQGREQSSE